MWQASQSRGRKLEQRSQVCRIVCDSRLVVRLWREPPLRTYSARPSLSGRVCPWRRQADYSWELILEDLGRCLAGAVSTNLRPLETAREERVVASLEAAAECSTRSGGARMIS